MQVDLFSFMAAQCALRLAEAGYPVPAGDDEGVVLSYKNVHVRRVPVAARTIHKSATYIVPAALLAGESGFLADVFAGADLRPYQSLSVRQPNQPDAMLFDFGIQHFHLGVGPHLTAPGFKARTGPLLFAVVGKADLYCIGIYEHGAWSQQALLDVIHANWPDLLAPFVINGVSGLQSNVTDARLAKLRKSQINCFTQRPDGTVHGQPGGGVTTAGNSLNSTSMLNDLRRTCDDLESQVRDHVTTHAQQNLPGKVDFEVQNGVVCALVPGLRIRLTIGLPSPL